MALSVLPAIWRLNQLEFLAEFQTLRALQIDVEVGESRIPVGARSTLGGEMHAVFTSEAQFEARGFLAQLGVDESAHGSLKRLGRLPALKEKPEIASHATLHLGCLIRVHDIDELARISEGRVERRVGQSSL